MSDTVIRVENLSKQYRLGEVGTGTISHDLNRWWAKVRGREDPFSKVGETNDRTKKGNSEYVWALRDINFEIKQGEVLGIIGRNGAGKSTLLKLLSKVTSPTTGSIKMKGRVASLLEVGTGFHPELTGRENVFLNGAILGMTKKEIEKKFDEIVDFAGVERYVDTPVKRYSSGMYVRLAFAVAAHLEPEILIVDEVLAVGDAEFQRKCLGKMNKVSKEDGRTILFVSHNMASVKALCSKGILLENGRICVESDITYAVSKYLNGTNEIKNKKVFNNEYRREEFTLHSIAIHSVNSTESEVLDEYSELELTTEITFNSNPTNLHLTFVLNGENGETLFPFTHLQQGLKLYKGNNKLICRFPKNFFNVGSYYLDLYVIVNKRDTVLAEKDIFSFMIEQGQREIGQWMGREPGFIKPLFHWQILID